MASSRPRQLLIGLLSLGGAFALLVASAYLFSDVFGSGTTPAPSESPNQPGQGTSPGANPIVVENQQPGTTDWRIANIAAAQGIEGYADHTSAAQGDTVTLYVSTNAFHFSVQAYRMGYYGGLGGRLIWKSAQVRGGTQAPAVTDNATHMVSAPWRPSLTMKVDQTFPPGDYLLKLVGDGDQQNYVPLTVVDPASTAPLVIVNAVTTWQAFNNWGGYDLYNGPDGQFASRSRVASFDRPYTLGVTNNDFLQDEFPLVYFAESYGLNVTYWTDVDLHERGPTQLADAHRGIVFLGHDEYWTQAMRASVTDARDRGVNVAFLGAESVFRQIRLQPSPLGPDRQVVDYKDAGEDPLRPSNPALVTVNWRDDPVDQPETALVGEEFECNPVQANGVVVDAQNWLFTGTGVHNGDTIANLVGRWYDRVNLNVPTPTTVEVLAHSPVNCAGVGPSYADLLYYSTPSGAGVLATGTGNWVCNLSGVCPDDTRNHPDDRILRITQNLLFAFAQGPAGLQHPSKPNLPALGIRQGPTGPTPGPTQGPSQSPK